MFLRGQSYVLMNNLLFKDIVEISRRPATSSWRVSLSHSSFRTVGCEHGGTWHFTTATMKINIAWPSVFWNANFHGYVVQLFDVWIRNVLRWSGAEGFSQFLLLPLGAFLNRQVRASMQGHRLFQISLHHLTLVRKETQIHQSCKTSENFP